MGAQRWLSVALLRAVSAGALVYGLKRPNPVPGVFSFPEIWHLFVVAGSACHFWAVLRYLAPIA
jgi:hemolysin III